MLGSPSAVRTGGESVTSQLGKWHGIKIELSWVSSFSLETLAKSQTEGQSGRLQCRISPWKLDFPVCYSEYQIRAALLSL